MSECFFTHTFPNGLTLVAQAIEGVQSAAFNLMIPAGAATDPVGALGSANVLADLLFRGAGQRDSRALNDHLDLLGLQRSGSVGIQHIRLAAAGVARNVVEALEAYADIVRRPMLPADGFEPARDLAIQSLQGLSDDPRQYLLTLLNEHALPAPRGRNPMGRLEDLENLTIERLAADFTDRFHASGTVLAIAGAIDLDEVRDRVARYFADWHGKPRPALPAGHTPRPMHHEPQESEQTHIGIAWPTVVETHPDYMTARVALEILSGGTSGRLFTELREKRGLVYHASASYTALKDYAIVVGYAGTSNDRAQLTLDTYFEQLNEWSAGISADELHRARIALKSATILSGESTSARAGALAHDHYIHGRLRRLEEIRQAIDAVSLDAVHAWLKQHPPADFTVVTVGPHPLAVSKSIIA